MFVKIHREVFNGARTFAVDSVVEFDEKSHIACGLLALGQGSIHPGPASEPTEEEEAPSKELDPPFEKAVLHRPPEKAVRK